MSKPIVFTNKNCRGCIMVKKLFDTNGVQYKEVNLAESPGDVAILKEKGYSSAPITLFDGEFFAGFNPDKIRAIIAKVKERGE